MKKIGIFFGLLALGVAGVWFYFTPQLAFREIRIAVRDRNMALLETRVNFPALRAGLKASAQSRLAEKISGTGIPFGRLGAALAGSVVDPLIDQLVTPETLAMLLRGDRSGTGGPPPEPRAPVGSASAKPPASAGGESGDAETETTKVYETFNRYVISVKKKGTPDVPIAFVLTRENLLDWKLSEIRNPF